MGKELKDIVAEMRELGVTRYKTKEVEVELGPEPKTGEAQTIDPLLREEFAKELADRKLKILFGASSMRPNLKR